MRCFKKGPGAAGSMGPGDVLATHRPGGMVNFVPAQGMFL